MRISFLLFLGVCSFANQSLAQISIDQADDPVIGDTVFWAADTMETSFLNLSVGTASSAAQTWDFTNITTDRQDTIAYITPPANSDFPSSTIAAGSALNALYMTSTSALLVSDGFAGDPLGLGLPVSVKFNPAQTINTYPTTMNTSFQSSSMFDVTIDASPLGLSGTGLSVDSVRLVHYSDLTSTVDAHGMITTAKGTFQTLRQFRVDETIDTIFAYICIGFPPFVTCSWSILDPALTLGALTANPIVDTVYTYNFLVNGEGYSIASAQTDANGNVEQAGYKTNLKTLSAIGEKAAIIGFKVHPNPTAGKVYITLAQSDEQATIKVYDLLGREVISDMPVTQELEVDLSHTKGVYMIELRQNGTTVRQRVIVE